MVVRLRAVGECGIEVGDARVGPDAELAFALLLILTLARGHAVPRRRLTDLLWPATSDTRARHNLRQTLYKLRQLGAPVESESLHVRLPADAVAPHVLLAGEVDGTPPTELLRPNRPFGEFLAGYVPTFSPPFAAWVDDQRSVMHARLRRAALALLLDERRRGNWAAVDTIARKVLQLDPLNEEATLALAEATALAGSKRAALALLDAYLRDLGDGAGDIRLPASLLRRRIAERLHPSLSPPDGEACFVGRSDSMAFLHDQFRHARTAGAHTVLLWGDAGIGKSRLATEFVRLAVLEGAQLARVGCQARDIERPLSIFVDVVPHLLTLPGALGCAPESMAYLRRLTAHDPAVLEPSAETREAELLFAYVRRAIFDLVDAVAAEAPLVLLVEDVHWLDEQSWRVLRELIGWLEGRRVLVLLTSRLPHATPAPPARRAAGVVEHHVGPLDREAALTLFDSAAAGVVAPDGYRAWCVQVAEGNPLFVRELVTHWATTGDTNAPRSLDHLISERIAALSALGRRVLQCAAALGSNSSFERVSRTLALPPATLLDALSENYASSLLGSTEGALRCRHALVEQACLRILSQEETAVMHQLCAMAIEPDVRRTASVALLWDCVRHWQEAGEHERAVAFGRASAAHMLEIGLPHIAGEILGDLLPHCTTDTARAECLQQRRDALRRSGEWTKLARVLCDLEHLGPRTPNSMPTTHSPDELLRFETSLRTTGDISSVMHDAIRCAHDRNAHPDHRREAAALALQCADNLFDQTAAEDVFQCASRIPYSAHPNATYPRLSAIYHNGFGNIDAAMDAARRWVACERDKGDIVMLSRALRNAAIPFRTGGDIDAAFTTLLESYELAAMHQLASSAANSADVLATVNLNAGNIDQAERWHSIALEWAERTEEAPVISSIQIVGVRLLLERGNGEKALAAVPFDMGVARTDPIRRRQVDRFALLAAVHLACGREQTALECLEELRSLHAAARKHHGHDFAASVLIRLLTADGRLAIARDLADVYVRDRRERSPLSQQMAEAISL